MKSIILASASPRRKQLLELAQIKFEVAIADTDEIFNLNLTPEEIATELAFAKADTINRKMVTNSDDYVIIGADTVVVCYGKILAKPQDATEAFGMLTMLSGKSHDVITGVCLLSANKKKIFASKTIVTFLELSKGQKEFYINTYKPFDKAGGYAIQEWIGLVGIEKIAGDYYNVMGLPVSRLLQELALF